MTTIAIKDNKVACDSQVTNGYTITSYTGDKVAVINGCIVAGAGSYAEVLKFRQWFADHSEALIAQSEMPNVRVDPPEDFVDKEFIGVVLYPEGGLFVYEGRSDVLIPKEQPLAIGSGSDFALAAMKAGVSAEDAVKIAIDLDVFSGGEVKVYELDESEPVTVDDMESWTKEEILAYLRGDDNQEQPTTKDEYEFPSEEIAQLLEDNISRDNETFVEDGSYVVFKGETPYLPYIIIYSNGTITDEDGSFTTFVDLDADKTYFYDAAKIFGVKHAHNISQEKLARRLDEKVAEIVREMNK